MGFSFSLLKGSEDSDEEYESLENNSSKSHGALFPSTFPFGEKRLREQLLFIPAFGAGIVIR